MSDDNDEDDKRSGEQELGRRRIYWQRSGMQNMAEVVGVTLW